MAEARQEPEPTDPVEKEILKIRRQLEELMRMIDGLDARINSFETSREEVLDLEVLKKRYSREALEMMMRIDYLEDPEDFDDFDEPDDLEEF